MHAVNTAQNVFMCIKCVEFVHLVEIHICSFKVFFISENLCHETDCMCNVQAPKISGKTLHRLLPCKVPKTAFDVSSFFSLANHLFGRQLKRLYVNRLVDSRDFIVNAAVMVAQP